MNEDHLRQARRPSQHRYHLLDAMRGLAALFVIPRHAPALFGEAWKSYNSFLAVDFFFCLSGFVVAYSYEKRLLDKLNLADFAKTRAIRLYPIAFLGTVLGVAAYFATASQIDIHFYARTLYWAVSGAFIIPRANGQLFPLDQPMWTLFFEVIANLLYASLVRWRVLSNKVLAGIIGLSFLGLILFRIHYGELDLGYNVQTAFFGLARVCFSFFVGVYLCRRKEVHGRKEIKGFKAQWMALGLSVLLILVLCNSLETTRTPVAQLLTIGLGFPLFIDVASQVDVPGRWMTTAIFLGTISYPIYLMHAPMLILIAHFLGKVDPAISPNWILAAIALLSAMAWLASEYYDRPVRKRLTQLLQKTAPKI